MLAYQSGIAKFDESGAKVFGISTDNTPSQREFGVKNDISVPFLSDFAKREVSAGTRVRRSPQVLLDLLLTALGDE